VISTPESREQRSVATDNLALWNRHRTPHKDALKDFTKRGGFKGTAIDPMWAIRGATEEWGTIGEGWGYEDISEDVRTLSEEWILHTITIKFWHGSRDNWFPMSGSTWLLAPGKYGSQYDDEAPKKSRTDALTKALSWLGFGADVYMGVHDGSKYADLTQDIKPTGVHDTSYYDEEESPTQTQDGAAEESERGNLLEADEEVRSNIQTLIDIIGEEKYKVWHDRVLSNFYGVDSIEKLSADELVDFADKQLITIKEHRE
jgi:hypothetical protein